MNTKLYNELASVLALAHYEETREANKAKIEKANKINSCREFQIKLIFNYKRDSGSFVERFSMEGLKNSLMILESYRGIGHAINLKKIEVYTNEGEQIKVKGITFNY